MRRRCGGAAAWGRGGEVRLSGPDTQLTISRRLDPKFRWTKIRNRIRALVALRNHTRILWENRVTRLPRHSSATLKAHPVLFCSLLSPSAMLAAHFASAVVALVTSPLSKPASIAATAEAAVAAAFTPAMATALAECNPSMPAHLRSQQVVAVMDNVLGTDVCERLRREAEALRAEGYLEECESSGNVRAIQCMQGDDEMRAVAEGLEGPV